MVKADAIYEMSHFIEGPNGLAEGELDDFYPALLQYSSWRGTLYCLPMEATNLGLLYNKDHFREVGLDPERPPQTWDELREYSRRLTRDLNGDGKYDRVGFAVPAVPATGPNGPYMMWTWFPWLWQAGGWLVNLEQTEVIFDEEPGVRALSLWKELYDTQQLKNFTNDWLIAFTSQQAAMIMDGPWNLPRAAELFKDIDWGIGMLPEGPARRATIVGGEYLAIFKQSDHPDEAWEFVKWITQPDVQAWWAMESGYLPVRKSSMEDPDYQRFLAENPPYRAFAEQMDYAVAQRPLDYYTEDIQRLVAQAMEKATVGGQDPATVLREAAEESNRLLANVQREPVAAAQ
jgi:ABC-type glycerol-3-phosphate transport system substrate-binding protein